MGWESHYGVCMHIIQYGTCRYISKESHGIGRTEWHTRLYTCILYGTCWYIPKDSHMVQRDGTDAMDSVHTCIWYKLVHSQGFPYSPMVQRDGTDTMDSVYTCIWYLLMHSQGSVQRDGTDTMDSVYSTLQCHTCLYSTCWYIPEVSHNVPWYRGMSRWTTLCT